MSSEVATSDVVAWSAGDVLRYEDDLGWMVMLVLDGLERTSSTQRCLCLDGVHRTLSVGRVVIWDLGWLRSRLARLTRVL